MSSPESQDPFEVWRQFMAKFESDINSMANDSMNSNEFSRGLHQFTQMSLGMQKTFEKSLDGYFKTLHLPSTKDIEAIGDTLRRLEEKIDMMSSPNRRDPQQARPLRTRQPSSEAKSPKASPDGGG
jgi:hypothetical protein